MALIDVGGAAVSGGWTCGAGNTNVETYNTANATGKLTSIAFYFTGNVTNVKSGTFALTGSSRYTVRAYATIGSVAGGSTQTFTGLSIDVTTGDSIGAIQSDNTIHAVMGYGSLFYSGDTFGGGEYYYSNYGMSGPMALYGTGVTIDSNIHFNFYPHILAH